jgi:GntR family carbon starvation induced transcriptional regulator
VVASVRPRRRDFSGEHLAIFEATLARDADLACRLHQEHIQRTVDIVVAAISVSDQDPFEFKEH